MPASESDMQEDRGVSLGKATLITATTSACLFRLDDKSAQKLWVPRGCIHEDSSIWKPGQEPDTLIVKEWWAEKKGF